MLRSIPVLERELDVAAALACARRLAAQQAVSGLLPRADSCIRRFRCGSRLKCGAGAAGIRIRHMRRTLAEYLAR